MFGLSPRVFIAKPGIQIGELSVLDGSGDVSITAAGIDSDDPDVYGLFSIEYMEGIDDLPASWYVTWTGEEVSGVERYDVPVYVEYVDGDGVEGNWKGSFAVFAKGDGLEKPTIQYIDNLATKVGSTELVTVYGRSFNDDLEVFLWQPDGECVKVPDGELRRSYGEDGGYDSISFMFGKPYVALDSSCREICGTYEIGIGYGECGAATIEAGTSDYSTAWDNNLYLIRYRYDDVNRQESEMTPGGSMVTVDPSCFYATDIELVIDDYDHTGRTPADGGVSGSLGRDIYFRIKPGTDCSKIAYYRVRLKYSRDLPKRYGELTLDGIRLTEGDLVWLEMQADGKDGLWIVQTGEWVGLKSYLDGQSGDDADPCLNPPQEPLPVDSSVLADLGVHVKDSVTVACDSDVPAEMRYGSQRICSTNVRPGDTVLLTNQSEPGTNGLWEVTCAEWMQRTDTMPAHSGSSISGDDFVVVQNDIDFCTCEHSGKNIFHIWYYYLNGACYLARASRNVKVTCGNKGTLFPSSGVDVTDYRITPDADGELVRDTLRTAGDPVRETCAEKVENYDADHRVGIDDTKYGCGQESVVAPNGIRVCRCSHVYNIDVETAFASRDRNGFSIVFWQLDGEDGKWHLYAYVGSGRYDTGMNYLVYHLCTAGIASEADVDVNCEILPYDADGKPAKDQTRDAWFVTHGGKLATGFGLFDDTWNFKTYEYERDSYGEIIYDDYGKPVLSDRVAYSHVLNADTLYSTWSVRCTTTLCAARVYRDSSILRTSCADMADAERTSSVMVDVIPTPDTWGFKFYNEAIGKSRLCDIWNSMPH